MKLHLLQNSIEDEFKESEEQIDSALIISYENNLIELYKKSIEVISSILAIWQLLNEREINYRDIYLKNQQKFETS